MNNKIIIKFFLVTVLSIICIQPCISEDNTQSKNEYNPKPASASLYNLGLKSYESGDYESAETFFKRSVELDPEFADAYFNLGAIYKKLKKYPFAINSFQKAVELNPHDYEAIFELGTSYFEDKNFLTAKKYFSALPTSFEKYDEASMYTRKINNYIAFHDTEKTSGDVGSPEFQAQLLVDTLTQPDSRIIARSDPTILINSSKTVLEGLFGPTGITKDTNGNLYIANFSNNRIEQITPQGQRKIFFEGSVISGPVGLAIDRKDNLYVANYNSGSVVVITPDKNVSVIIDNLKKPYYLFYDEASSKLLVTVQGSNSLIEIDTGNISKQPITAR